MVRSDYVNSRPGQPSGDLLALLMGGKIGACREAGSPKLSGSAILKDELISVYLQKTMFAGRFFTKE